MNLDSINKWLTLIANMGVLAGVIFLVFELQQNNVIAKAETRSEITRFQLQNRRMFRDPVYLEISEKRSNSEELTFQEGRWLRSIFTEELKAWENVYYQYRVGLFDEPELEAYRVTWRGRVGSCQNTWFFESYEELRMQLEPLFRSEIDSIIANSSCQ